MNPVERVEATELEVGDVVVRIDGEHTRITRITNGVYPRSFLIDTDDGDWHSVPKYSLIDRVSE